MKTKEIIENSLNKIFSHIGIKPKVSIEEKEENVYSILVDGNDLNFLIGFRGQSLDALQNILKMIVFRKTQNQPIITLDINQYRDRKVERIQDLTRSFIDKVRFFQKEMELPRMNPWERRQVHVLISEYDDIFSESTGEGENRRVVLKPKNQTLKKTKEE